jgi:tagaturonate reductase
MPIVVRHVERAGAVPQSLAFGFAAYLLFMQGRYQASRRARGLAVRVDDQGARLHSLWSVVPDDVQAPVGELVWSAGRDTSLWGVDLTTLPGFCEAVADHLWRMRALGMTIALDHHLASSVT